MSQLPTRPLRAVFSPFTSLPFDSRSEFPAFDDPALPDSPEAITGGDAIAPPSAYNPADTDSDTPAPLVLFPDFGEVERAGSHSIVVRGVNSYPTEVPIEDVILGRSYVRKGDIVNLVSGAGMGKSVAGNQAPMAFALGLPYFGIAPPRPLRCLIFSGEDDGVTIGQCREGFLDHSRAITGSQLTAADLAPLDSMIRTEFSRSYVSGNFHLHLDSLLREEPADLVVINPLLSYVGGEIVACASEWLRAGLMPVLQEHQCAALILHHTPKLSKDSWETMDDTYSAIGGGEIANVPRSILTLKPTPVKGLFVLTVSKRQTTGWTDGNGNSSTNFFIKRSADPERPAWIPVSHNDAMEAIDDNGPAKCGRNTKATVEHVVEALQVGPTQRQALIQRVMSQCKCSDRTAKTAITAAENCNAVVFHFTPNPRGGNPTKWLRIPSHPPHGVEEVTPCLPLATPS